MPTRSSRVTTCATTTSERLIPEMLGKSDAPEGVVAETWEISDYRETTGTVANGPYAGRTLHELVEEFS